MREVAVFTALRAELCPLKALLCHAERQSGEIPIHTGEIEGTRVILVCSGIGEEPSVAAAEAVRSKYSPSAVLSTGFCGGLVRELGSCDVVLSSWVVSTTLKPQENSKKLFLRDETISLRRFLEDRGVRARVGGFASVPRPVLSPGEKRQLAHRTGALVVEMETFHLGAFFLAQEVPFVGMRVVFDSLEDCLPVGQLAMEKLARWGARHTLWQLLLRAGDHSRIWWLSRNWRRAQVVLGKTTAAVVGSWSW